MKTNRMLSLTLLTGMAVAFAPLTAAPEGAPAAEPPVVVPSTTVEAALSMPANTAVT